MSTDHDQQQQPSKMEARILGGPSQEYQKDLNKPTTIECFDGIFTAASFRGFNYKDMNEDRVVLRPDIPAFAVIDGMGGPGGGERAADILAKGFAKMSNYPKKKSLIKLQVDAAQRMKEECSNIHSGACFALGWLEENETNVLLKICYAGDVKIIVLNPKFQCKFETRDHSLLNQWVDAGHLTEAEALRHPQRDAVTKAVSGEAPQDCEFTSCVLEPGDTIVSASDGLWDNFTVEETAQILAGEAPVVNNTSQAVSLLMRKALEKMRLKSTKWEGVLNPKPDNISIMVAKFTSVGNTSSGSTTSRDRALPSSSSLSSPAPPSRSLVSWILAIAVASVQAAVISAILLLAFLTMMLSS